MGEATGTLYVMATPIGNLEDLSFRAARVLGEVDLIAAEDTRHTRVLLARYGVSKPLRSLHGDSRAPAVAALVEELRAGRSVAYVSDAGTPGLADPGAELVRAAREAGAPVVPLPGPCAPAVAFSVSGLETAGFVFAGFVPRQAGPRREFLRRWLGRELPVIVFESPQRIEATLGALAELAPDRTVVVGREMTKAFEQIVAGPARELPAALSPEQRRGEFTLVIAGAEEPEPPGAAGPEELAEAVGLLREAGVPRKTVARVLQLLGGLSRNEAYGRAGRNPTEDAGE